MDIKAGHEYEGFSPIKRYQAGCALMIELRKKRIQKLRKQLANAMYRVMDLEAMGGEDTESYISALLKAKECSCLIKLHEEATKDSR